MNRVKILYIDDEIRNLNAFKASFRRQFDVFTALSAAEGLKILESTPIEVVLSDQKMPEKTGIDFFESIIETHPNPIRILLTGYSDINAVIDAINKGRIYQYVAKPWNDYDLKLTIENAYNLYCLKERNKRLSHKYEKVFKDSSDPIILFDTDGRIIDLNKSAKNFIGERDKSTEKLSLFDLVINEEDVDIILSKLNKNEIFPGYECQLYGIDKEIRNCLISANKIKNNYGEVLSYQFIIKDITERSKLNQLLLKTTIETQELERERISRDLHDGIGQSLAAIKLHMESLRMNNANERPIDSELKTIPIIVQDAIEELRRICFNTLPLILQEYGLITAVDQLKKNVSNQNFTINFNYDNDFITITKSLEITIFRIIQEFINNSIKHGAATEVLINLENVDDLIILNLKDNGIGFNINNLEVFKGNGLKNIQSRIDSFNGSIDIKSKVNDGTNFDITFPLHLN